MCEESVAAGHTHERRKRCARVDGSLEGMLIICARTRDVGHDKRRSVDRGLYKVQWRACNEPLSSNLLRLDFEKETEDVFFKRWCAGVGRQALDTTLSIDVNSSASQVRAVT